MLIKKNSRVIELYLQDQFLFTFFAETLSKRKRTFLYVVCVCFFGGCRKKSVSEGSVFPVSFDGFPVHLYELVCQRLRLQHLYPFAS